ncbi:SDR family oxidoreductase [Lentilitoribacter sp. EG35]|uniref:SDR family oxidoreductase n=1 Tax=Lentilitoribacter sp. EG35 TaxID=3234192 RepID=UPI00345F57F8
MGERLKGKTALLTAAGQGIGRATAIAMANEGAQVIASDINEDALNNLSAETNGNITITVLDVRSDAAVEQAAKDYSPNVLFNCTGFVHSGTVLECTDDEWDFAFDLNVKSAFRMIKAFLPSMIEQGNGSIINMASAASSIIGAPNRFVYGATKAAVIGMTKSVAVDHIKMGIRCNAICPGTVQSPSLEDRLHAMGDYEEARKAFIARQPMGRIGTPEEIAALAVYLASEDSAFTTGQAMLIDGGWAG